MVCGLSFILFAGLANGFHLGLRTRAYSSLEHFKGHRGLGCSNHRRHEFNGHLSLQMSASGAINAPSPINMIIAGAPAAGKGTQCEVIKAETGAVHLSTGDILRAAVKEGTPLGQQAKAFMDGGQLVPDELIIGVVCDRLREADCQECGWLLDGFPRTAMQAQALSQAGFTPDCFLLLDVPPEVLVERVTGRRTDPQTGKIYHLTFNPPPTDDSDLLARLVQRSDDTEEKIIIRYDEFRTHIDAISAAYEDITVCVDGAQPSAQVSAQLIKGITTAAANAAHAAKGGERDDALLSLRGGASKAKARRAAALQVQLQRLGGVAILLAADNAAKGLFARAGVSFPPALAAMVALFCGLAGASLVPASAPAAREAYAALAPAAALLKLWLPLFFVPPLVVLPLRIHLIKGLELQTAVVLVLGFVVSAVGAGKVASALLAGSPDSSALEIEPEPKPMPELPPARVPAALAAVSLALVAAKVRMGGDRLGLGLGLGLGLPLSTALLRLGFGLTSTVAAYVAAARRTPAQLRTRGLHPVISTTFASALAQMAFGVASGVGAKAGLASYYVGAASARASPGDWLTRLLGPAIVSFAVQLFQFRRLLAANAAAILGTTGFSALLGLYSSATLARLAGLGAGGAPVCLAPLTRCITTPLALSGAALTGADPSLSALFVVITGILGASVGEAFLGSSIGGRVTGDLPVGLSVGAAAHGLGAAALASKPQRFAAAVVSMTLTGLWTVLLVSVPGLRGHLIRLAMGI